MELLIVSYITFNVLTIGVISYKKLTNYIIDYSSHSTVI